MRIRYKKEITEEKISPQEIINILLKNRSIRNPEDFLHPASPFSIDLTDINPHASNEVKKTIALLKTIKKNKEMIVIYTDYDADGITGGAILWETLYLLGFRVMPYVPHRKHEGYGFSKKGIDAVKKEFNPRLIISVDHGISAREKIEYADSLGISVIVTDHHVKPDKLPKKAKAIFYFPELSGAGVSYFFAKMLFHTFGSESKFFKKILQNFESDYLALASIGIIADLVPLIGISRNLVFHGLKAFPKIKRYGITHLLKGAGIFGKPITPYEIGFMIAPRINAIGRLEHALDALRLLCTQQEQKALELAKKVGKKNTERQDLVEKSLVEAKEMLKSIPMDKTKLIILVSKDWHEGIIGLIASKITEEYYRPTIIMTKVDGFYKGSARSIPVFHITHFLQEMNDFLIDCGGHTQASGFTIEEKKVKQFIKTAQKKADVSLEKKDLEKTITADFKIPVSCITHKLAQALETLEPFGIGNPKPLFYSNGELIDVKIFGKNNTHMKLFVKDRSLRSFPLECIMFNSANLFLSLSKGKAIDIVYTIDINRWSGRENVRGIVKEIYIVD